MSNNPLAMAGNASAYLVLCDEYMVRKFNIFFPIVKVCGSLPVPRLIRNRKINKIEGKNSR